MLLALFPGRAVKPGGRKNQVWTYESKETFIEEFWDILNAVRGYPSE